MSTIELDITKQYTYADYLKWVDGKRRELIYGVVKLMSPAPKRIHQEITTKLLLAIGNYLNDKQCKIYPVRAIRCHGILDCVPS